MVLLAPPPGGLALRQAAGGARLVGRRGRSGAPRTRRRPRLRLRRRRESAGVAARVSAEDIF
eukprot:3180743-Lingulodinium_polyedra.AAC.1